MAGTEVFFFGRLVFRLERSWTTSEASASAIRARVVAGFLRLWAMRLHGGVRATGATGASSKKNMVLERSIS